MGFFDRLFGGARRAKARADEAATRARETLGRGDAAGAFTIACAALAESASDTALLTIASECMAIQGEAETAELFLRAADAPHDVQRLLELGSDLLSHELDDVAVAILNEALVLAPFDAVVRSELALAYAHYGRPTDVVATLAMHPCLADDPGALFAFAWASLLSGDLGAAESSAEQLAGHVQARPLHDKLRAALARTEIPPDVNPPDARDFYFLEYGGIVLSLAEGDGGRYGPLDFTEAVVATILGRAAFALDAMGVSDRPCVPANDAAKPLAEKLAAALGTYVTAMPAHGRLPRMILVAQNAEDFEAHVERFGSPSEVVTFALSLPWANGVALAPDVVGAMVRRARYSATTAEPSDLLDPALSLFLTARKKHLPAADQVAHSAYAPDAPLPRPSAEIRKSGT